MDKLVELQIAEAQEHSILPNAKHYDVRAIKFNWHEERNYAELFIEASTHEKYVVLKFEGVEELTIPCGDTMSSILLIIQDTSKCPSSAHYIPPVRVGGAGVTMSGLRFWANSVECINES